MEEFVAGRWGGLRRPAISRLTELDLSIPTLAAEQLGIHPILASRLREGFDVDHRELTGDAAAMRALLAVGDIWNVRGMARVLGRKAPAEVLALVRMDVTAQLEALHKNVRRLLGAGGGAIAMLPGYSPQQAGSVWRLELVSAAASAGGADQGAELCAGIHGLPSVVVVDPPLGMPRLGPIRAARVGGPETVDLTVQPGVWPLAFSGVFDGEVRTLGGLGMPSQADVADTVGDVLLSPLAKIVASYSVSLELTRDIRFYS